MNIITSALPLRVQCYSNVTACPRSLAPFYYSKLQNEMSQDFIGITGISGSYLAYGIVKAGYPVLALTNKFESGTCTEGPDICTI